MHYHTSLLFLKVSKNGQQILQQIRLLTGFENAQQRFSTRFAVLLLNKLHFFVARLTKALV